MVLLDSSVIIAYFREIELDHKRAEKIFDEHEELIIPDVVMSEVLTILKMKEGLEKAGLAAEFLINGEGIEMIYTDDEIFDASLGDFISQKNKLSFVDTLLLRQSNQQRIPLVTFDKELAKLAKSRRIPL